MTSGRLPRLAGRSPQLTVIVRTQAGCPASAELEGVGPISLGTLARLRGQDHLERKQKVDGRGVNLNFGRARRCFSENQRRELAEMPHSTRNAAGGGTDRHACTRRAPSAWEIQTVRSAVDVGSVRYAPSRRQLTSMPNREWYRLPSASTAALLAP